jgi:hypothetical protein
MVRGIKKIFKAASWLKIKFLNRHPILQKAKLLLLSSTHLVAVT